MRDRNAENGEVRLGTYVSCFKTILARLKLWQNK